MDAHPTTLQPLQPGAALSPARAASRSRDRGRTAQAGRPARLRGAAVGTLRGQPHHGAPGDRGARAQAARRAQAGQGHVRHPAGREARSRAAARPARLAVRAIRRRERGTSALRTRHSRRPTLPSPSDLRRAQAALRPRPALSDRRPPGRIRAGLARAGSRRAAARQGRPDLDRGHDARRRHPHRDLAGLDPRRSRRHDGRPAARTAGARAGAGAAPQRDRRRRLGQGSEPRLVLLRRLRARLHRAVPALPRTSSTSAM